MCCCLGVCASSSPTPPAGPPERTAWLHLVQIHPVHSGELEEEFFKDWDPCIAYKTKEELMKLFNISWQDLEQGTKMDLHLYQSLLLPWSNEITCFGKLRESFPHPVRNLFMGDLSVGF